jgi:hypothetical protein
LTSFARARSRLSKGRRRKMKKDEKVVTTLTIDDYDVAKGTSWNTLTIAQIDAIQDPKQRVDAINKHLSQLFARLVWPGDEAKDVIAAD